MNKKGLGKGLGALIESAGNEGAGVLELKINDIEPNLDQPRKHFDDEKLAQLSESIKQHGVVQPIIVSKENNVYRIVAGERRWRAARLAGLATVPVIEKSLSSRQVMEIALIENLQREDLNPIEEAEAFERLIKEYNMTQEDIAKTVGRSRSSIANSVRLLHLCSDVKELVISGILSSGHARALIVLEDDQQQKKLAQEIIDKNLNVRETENLVKKFTDKKEKKIVREENVEIKRLEDKLKEFFGTKVKLVYNNNKGKIMIEYYSHDELDRLLELFDTMSQKN